MVSRPRFCSVCRLLARAHAQRTTATPRRLCRVEHMHSEQPPRTCICLCACLHACVHCAVPCACASPVAFWLAACSAVVLSNCPGLDLRKMSGPLFCTTCQIFFDDPNPNQWECHPCMQCWGTTISDPTMVPPGLWWNPYIPDGCPPPPPPRPAPTPWWRCCRRRRD